MQQQWQAVDDYLAATLIPEDAVLTGALARSEAAGLPPINVTPAQGALLNLLARLLGATRILEIGTLGGYSTIWLARALSASGIVVTVEAAPAHAAVARDNFAAAGLADQVEVIEGPALEMLPTLRDQAPFDLIFIDADKPNNPGYVEWALRLIRPGGLIILDNVVRGGRVTEPGAGADVTGVRAALDMLAADPRVRATALQTVGGKGYDGFALAYVS